MPYSCSSEKRKPLFAGNPLVAVHSVYVHHEKAARRDYFLRSGAKKWMGYSIPSDFYLHQLLKKRDSLLKEDTRTLASWCKRWGAMEHPMRYRGVPERMGRADSHRIEKQPSTCVPQQNNPVISDNPDEVIADLKRRIESCAGKWTKVPMNWSLPVLSGSSVFPCFSPGHLREVGEAIMRTDSVREETGDEYAISMQECRLAIQDVSEAIEFMNRLILEGDDFLLDDNGNPRYEYTPINLLSYGIVNEWQIACKAIVVEREKKINLTNAVCNQILASVMDTEPWRVCPQCGAPYKRYQHDAGDYGEGKRRSASAYCSAQCANKASKEAKEKSRNRIQH